MKSPLYTFRYWTIVILLAIAGLGLMTRMFYLMVFDRTFLLGQGDARSVRMVQTQAYRGMILDRFSNPLAVSAPVDAAWADPQTVKALPKAQLQQLAKILEIPFSTLQQRLNKKNVEFMYLQRQMPPSQTDKLKALNLPGIFFKREYRRYYPEGEVAAHVVGFTNVDDNGQEGIELEFNNKLKGIQGSKQVLKDRLGYIVSEIKELAEPKSGDNVTLSIDNRIQYLAYRTLKDAVEKNNAAGGAAIVLDIKTGEVLAMVNQPSYNPNNRTGTPIANFRNRAVTDTFEPGSTIKPFVVAMALDANVITPDTILKTAPGYIQLGKNRVEDEHNKDNITVTKALQISSNVGMTRILLSMPTLDSFPRYLANLGVGTTTGSSFPGESTGQLVIKNRYSDFTAATLSFGYGLTVTPLQLARLYSILGNDGKEIPITFLKVDSVPEGKQLMDQETTEAVLTMMRSVVEKGGTAPKARVPGYWVAGKTGTSRIVGAHGYEKNRYNSFFAGLAPVTDPQLVVVVLVTDPRGKLYYGGDVAAPAFSTIMGGSLRLLNIPPDHLEPNDAKKKA